MRAIFVRSPGRRRDDLVSPALIVPLAIVPEKPRKSRCGRLTHCTGMRKGSAGALILDIDRLEIGDERRAVIPGRLVAARRDIVAEARRNRNGDDAREAERRGESGEILRRWCRTRARRKSTRSILLTASTTCLMPSRETIAACRCVCVSRPLRASTSRMARSAFEAPVAMLRVYCSWPGVSATMKERFGVEK